MRSSPGATPSKPRASTWKPSTTRGWRRPRRPNDARVRPSRLLHRLHAENCPRIGGGGDDIAKHFDDLDRLFHQRGIARRELAFLEIDVVFESDAGMATEQ